MSLECTEAGMTGMVFEDLGTAGETMSGIRYCCACGSAVALHVPPGDDRPRHVCLSCQHIQYLNPRVIVGCIPESEDGRILLCRRNIAPRLGLWTFPSGFLELDESTAEAAHRETLEETQAQVDVGELLAVINHPQASQLYVIHHARMRTLHHGRTPESCETQLVRESEVPWEHIAFPTVYHGLKFFFADRAAGTRTVHTLTIDRPTAPTW